MDDKRQRTLQDLQRELQTIQPSDPLVKDRIARLNDEISRVVNDPQITGNLLVFACFKILQVIL